MSEKTKFVLKAGTVSGLKKDVVLDVKYDAEDEVWFADDYHTTLHGYADDFDGLEASVAADLVELAAMLKGIAPGREYLRALRERVEKIFDFDAIAG